MPRLRQKTFVTISSCEFRFQGVFLKNMTFPFVLCLQESLFSLFSYIETATTKTVSIVTAVQKQRKYSSYINIIVTEYTLLVWYKGFRFCFI